VSIFKSFGKPAPDGPPSGLFVRDTPGEDRPPVQDVVDVDAIISAEAPVATEKRSILGRMRVNGTVEKSLDVQDASVVTRADPSIAEPAGFPERVESLANSGAAAIEEAPAKRSFFSRRPAEPTAEQSAGTRASKEEARRASLSDFQEVPIQVIMGYLPDVGASDALEYAQGMAEKYVAQPGLSFYHTTKYDRGFIYEVQEGGPGKALGPAIAKYFQSKGAYRDDEPLRVVVRTAGRMVEVARQRDGVSVVLLPEAATDKPDDWLVGTLKMTPAVPRRKGMLYAGIAMLSSGVLMAGATGAFFRLQGYSAPLPPRIEQVQFQELPHKQWEKSIQRLAPGQNVKALRYANNAWQPVELWGDAPLPIDGPVTAPVAVPSPPGPVSN